MLTYYLLLKVVVLGEHHICKLLLLYQEIFFLCLCHRLHVMVWIIYRTALLVKIRFMHVSYLVRKLLMNWPIYCIDEFLMLLEEVSNAFRRTRFLQLTLRLLMIQLHIAGPCIEHHFLVKLLLMQTDIVLMLTFELQCQLLVGVPYVSREVLQILTFNGQVIERAVL